MKITEAQREAITAYKNATRESYAATQSMVNAMALIQEAFTDSSPEHKAAAHTLLRTAAKPVLDVKLDESLKMVLEFLLRQMPREPIHLPSTDLVGVLIPGTLFKPQETSTWEFSDYAKENWSAAVQALADNGMADCLRKQLTATAYAKASPDVKEALEDFVDSVKVEKWSVTKQK